MNLQNHLSAVRCAWRRSLRISRHKAHCWATLLAHVDTGRVRAAGYISWRAIPVTGNVLGVGKICETGWAQHSATPTVRPTGLLQLRFVGLPRMSCRPWLSLLIWSNWQPGSCVTCSITLSWIASGMIGERGVYRDFFTKVVRLKLRLLARAAETQTSGPSG